MMTANGNMSLEKNMHEAHDQGEGDPSSLKMGLSCVEMPSYNP